MRVVASRELPVLIYGRNWRHVDVLINQFCFLCRRKGIVPHRVSRDRVRVEGEALFWFRGMEEDSPRGMDFADIFVDHYVEE